MRRFVSILLALAVLTVFASETAVAQHHSKRGLQVGFKFGLSSYNGDITIRRKFERKFDATYEGELFYRFDRRLGIGLKQSIGHYPELSLGGSRRNSTAIAVRSYLLKTRLAPYVQVGASRTSGGDGTGYGIAFATGFELEISRYVALYQDISFDQVLPDKALDGVTGGRRFDLFGRVGVGLRVNFVRSQNSLFVSIVEIPDSLSVGEMGQFRAVVDGQKDGDLAFTWKLPEGTVYKDNPIQHSFSKPGTYEIELAVASSDELVRETFVVTVSKPFSSRETRDVLAGDDWPFVPVTSSEALRPADDLPVAVTSDDAEIIVTGDTVSVIDVPVMRETLPVADEAPVAVTLGDSDTIAAGDTVSVIDVPALRQTLPVADDPPAAVTVDGQDTGAPGDTLSAIETQTERETSAPEDVPPGTETLEERASPTLSTAVADTLSEIQSPTPPEILAAAEIPPVAEVRTDEDLPSASDTISVVETTTVVEEPVEAEAELAEADLQVDETSPPAVATPEMTEQSSLADRPATSNVSDINPDTPVAPNQPGDPGFEPSRTRFNAGDYAWVVETVSSESVAIRRIERYQYLSLPFGYHQDSSTGQYHILVGQFATEQVANNVARRIQSHAPRVIWLYKIK